MTTEFVTSADGTKIAYVKDGSGPPLVFAHGASGDKHTNPELQSLLRRDFEVAAYDRRGRGESGDQPDYDFLKEADDLRAVVSVVGNRPLVFGVSMGARIALEMLRDPPELSAMVLFEAPATNQRDPEFNGKLEIVRREMEAHGNEAGVVLHSRLFHRRSNAEIDELKRDIRRWKLRIDSFPITLREMEAVHRGCLFDPQKYTAPTYPVCLLTGDATLPFLRNSGVLISKLPFVRTHVLNGGNHSAPSNDASTVCNAFLHATHSA